MENTKEAALKKDVELEQHQKRVLRDPGSKLLYWGTGSGKSLGSIAATEGQKTDVVVPAALRENYRAEVNKHTDNTTKRRIQSYESVTRKGLGGGDALVVDEVQRINNASSARSKALLNAASRYKKRLVLSGTPIKNHPSEIAPIMHVVDPKSKLPLDPEKFSDEFIQDTEVSPGFFRKLMGVKPGIVQSAKNLDRFRDQVRGKIDYHSPEAKDYPSHNEKIVQVPMSDEQENVYNTVTNKANPALAWKIKRNMPLSKQESSNLNAFMSGARAVSNTASPFGGKSSSPKMLRMAKDIEDGIKNNPNFKSVTYSNYLESGANELSKHLNEKGIGHGVFHGGLSDKKRAEVVKNYNEGKIRSLLISGAGAEGIDLKGTRLMQIMEPHWNKARLDQAKGRAIRFKSHEHLPEDERHVDVVHYHSTRPQGMISKFFGRKPGTAADEYLHNLSLEKQKLNDQFLNVLKREGEGHKKTAGENMETVLGGFEKRAGLPYLRLPKFNVGKTSKNILDNAKADAEHIKDEVKGAMTYHADGTKTLHYPTLMKEQVKGNKKFGLPKDK